MNCDCKSEVRYYPRRVVVEKPGTTEEDDGQINLADDDNWVRVGVLYVRFVTRGGKESRLFDQLQSTVDVVIRCPNQTITRSLDPSWRLKMQQGDRWRKFNIVAAYLEDEDPFREFVIQAKERKP